MRLRSILHTNRLQPGVFEVIDDGGMVVLSARCLGHADRAEAATHGNPSDDPTKSHGDHPIGLYDCTRVVQNPVPAHSYGDWLIDLNPCGATDDAARAKADGRTGLAIHEGDLNGDGSLRPTYGCLRVDKATMDFTAPLVRAKLNAGERVFYACGVEATDVVST